MLKFINVSEITLRGTTNTSSARISLGQNGTILCNNVSNFHIDGIIFTLCKFQCNEESALKFVRSSQIEISNSGFLGSGKTNTRSVHAQHSKVTVLHSNFEGNLADYGGAVLATGLGSVITISECTLTGNRAVNGGAIFIGQGVVITISGCTFVRNRAMKFGGAISAIQGNVILNPGNLFRYNAGGRGGAMDLIQCEVRMTGTNTFESNKANTTGSDLSGGAISIGGCNLMMSGKVLFSKNEAKRGGAIGMYTSNNVSCSFLDSIVMDRNKAEYGGGMYIRTFPSLHLHRIQASLCDLKFVDNVATVEGGAVSIDSRSNRRLNIDPYLEPEVELSGNFTNNRAKRGGAVFINSMRKIKLKFATITGNSASALFVSESILRS